MCTECIYIIYIPVGRRDWEKFIFFFRSVCFSTDISDIRYFIFVQFIHCSIFPNGWRAIKLMTADEIINNNSRQTTDSCQTYLVIDSFENVTYFFYVYRCIYTRDNNIPFKTVNVSSSLPPSHDEFDVSICIYYIVMRTARWSIQWRKWGACVCVCGGGAVANPQNSRSYIKICE